MGGAERPAFSEGKPREDEAVGWHHRLSGHAFEQIPGDSEGEGSLASMRSQSPTRLSD